MAQELTLDGYLSDWAGGRVDRCRIASAITALTAAAKEIAHTIRRGPLAGNLAEVTGDGASGDVQKALDARANTDIVEALRRAGVAAVVSEEMESPEVLNADGGVVIAVDPLDGSSNIDANVSIGTIFSVFSVPSGDALAAFSQAGSAQVAAGYVIYGPHVALALTVCEGTLLFTLDPDTKQFVTNGHRVSVPPETREYAINSSNYRHWSDATRAYVSDCNAGIEGPRESEFNMRWIASLVAECQRILMRGGVFLYPRDSRKGYAKGRLRLLYEANPIALLIEQAGGKAIDGTTRILDLTPESAHERTPLIFGSAKEVERIGRYKSDPDAMYSRSPLFAHRGLLTSGRN